MAGMVDPNSARTEEYRRQLEEIEAAGVCPFCPENFLWHPHPVLYRVGGWLITHNRENYPGSRLHLLIVGNEHKEELTELTAEDLVSVRTLVFWAKTNLGFSGGGLAVRTGPSSLTGASVAHLHFHLIEPLVNEETGRAEPVWFPIG